MEADRRKRFPTRTTKNKKESSRGGEAQAGGQHAGKVARVESCCKRPELACCEISKNREMRVRVLIGTGCVVMVT